MGSSTNELPTLPYRSIFRVLGVLAILGFFFLIRDVVVLVFVALVFSAAIDPWVDSLAKRQIPRSLGIVIIYVIVIAVFCGTITLLIPPLIEQVRLLANNFPFYYDKLSLCINYLRDASASVGAQDNFQQVLGSIERVLSTATAGVFSTVSSIFGGIVSFFLVLVLTFYMVVEEDGIKRFLKVITPDHVHEELGRITEKIQNKIGQWLRGQLILMAIIFFVTFIGLKIIGVPYALVLALVAGITEIIPYAGPILGAMPAVFIAFTISPVKGLLAVLLYFLIQQAENHLIVPKVMQRTTGLNPIIVIVAVLVGAQLAGVLGALLAVPIAAALEVVIHERFDKKS